MKKITIHYFARLREQLACEHENVELPDTINTVADLRGFLTQRGDNWQKAMNQAPSILTAVNQTMAGSTQVINDNDEVAFFPPVTGG
jgi:molybdopterin synthase sulfur carrier subunit